MHDRQVTAADPGVGAAPVTDRADSTFRSECGEGGAGVGVEPDSGGYYGEVGDADSVFVV